MGRDKSLFIVGGLAAFAFYLLVLWLLILFFNDYKKTKRYVPENTQRIEVAIIEKSSRKRIQKPKPSPKKERKTVSKPKPAKKSSSVSAKERVASKPKAISSLFEGIKADAPLENRLAARIANAPKIDYKASSSNETQNSERASRIVRDINLSKPEIDITSKSSGVGEVDEYMSKLYDIIYKSWHPEAIYAGEEAKARLQIMPDGSFDYTLLYPSDNRGFNQSLIEYLDRLKAAKLPPHKRDERLDVDIEFKAKE